MERQAKVTKLRWFDYEYINQDFPLKFFVFKDICTDEHIGDRLSWFHHMIIYDSENNKFNQLNLHDGNLMEIEGGIHNHNLLKIIFTRLNELEALVKVYYPELANKPIIDVF
jgi:hypothetical protein